MSLAYNFSARNRQKKWSIFLKEFSPFNNIRILDIGYTEDEYSVTDNFIEKHYPRLDKLTALGIDFPEKFKNKYPGITAVQYDGTIFPFKDKAFDIAWSNAVIEHVGDKEKQIFFLKEIHRISKRAFITTPNKFFPVEVHTRIPLLHFLPKKLFDQYLKLIGKKWAADDYMCLLSKQNLRSIIESAEIKKYRIIKNRLSGFTLDFIIIIN